MDLALCIDVFQLKLGISQNDAERRVDFMGHSGGQLPDRFHFLGLGGPVLDLLEFVDVPAAAMETGYPAVGIADRGFHNVVQ